jgi:CubicO group peptidase (beta-lactamase class C family)
VRHGIELRGHRGHWGVVMHVDPRSGLTVTGTINQADRRPDALLDGALAAVLDLVPQVRP